MDNRDPGTPLDSVAGSPASTGETPPGLDRLAHEYLDGLRSGVESINASEVADVVHRLRDLGRRQGTCYVFGNGGSAATAVHFVNDVVRVVPPTGSRLRMHCLSENVSTITAIANDYTVEDIFTRQLDCCLTEGDLVIGISTRGTSANVVSALRQAKASGAETIGLVGFDGGELRRLADHVVHVPVDDVQQVEDLHHAVCHMISGLLGQT